MTVYLSYFSGAGAQLFDDNGVPLSGGLLYTYLAGTTTPAATYTTSAGNVANSNPIVLDAAGRTPDEIWLTSGTNYKFVLKTSAGVTLGTYDDIPGVNDPTAVSTSIFSQLANTSDAAKGDALIGFKQANPFSTTSLLTDAVARTVHQKFTEMVSLRDFGAKGDGSSDDTSAFQAAINACANNNITLFVPDGTYMYSSIVVPSGKAISLMGSSKANAILKQINASASTGPAITATGSFFAEEITFDQNWLTSYSVGSGYNDGADPNTWGGYFIASISATPDLENTEPIVNIQNCNILNTVRGFLITGAVTVDFFNNYSNTLNASTATQSIIAMSQCQQVSCTANTLITEKWTNYTSLPAYYGLSGIYTWGCTNVEVSNNTFVGFQLVTRGGNATFTATISGTTMTVSAVASGKLIPGMVVSGTNVWADNTIVKQLTGTAGGTGTYQLSFSNTGALPVTALAARCNVNNNIIDTPIADTAAFYWKYVLFSGNLIRMSGDMGITYDSAQYVTITGNVIDGTQIGGIGGVATFPIISITITGNVIKDIAQGTNGPYAVLFPISGRQASNGGAFLSAISFFYSGGGTGNAALTITGNSITFENLPPVSDAGGPVRVAVNGVYLEQSTNPAATYTGTVTGNFVEDREADMPRLFVNAASHYFYLNGAFTGTPTPGEVFANGSDSFVFLSGFPPIGLCYIKKLIGTVPNGTVFTGTSGATLTSAASPQLTFINVTGAANNDFTTTYANQNLGI